jgi:hypothetical protein
MGCAGTLAGGLPDPEIFFHQGAAFFPLYIAGMRSKPIFAGLLGALALGIAMALPNPSQGQAVGDEAAIATLIEEITAQQNLIEENQTKLDGQLAAISESIRVARIHAARGGGKAGK